MIESSLEIWRRSVGNVDGIDVGDVLVEPIIQLVAGQNAAAWSGGSGNSFVRGLSRMGRVVRQQGYRFALDALLDRFDHYRRWSGLMGSSEVDGELIATSSYSNTSAALLRYSEYLDHGVLGWTRWGAANAWRRGSSLPDFCWWSLPTGTKDEEERLTREIVSAWQSGFAVLRAIDPSMGPRVDELSRLAEHVFAPELAAFWVRFENLVGRKHLKLLTVGNEFSVCDRLALHLARANRIPSVSFAHGILDYHYAYTGVLADRFVTWTRGSADYACASGMTSGERVLAVRPSWAVESRDGRSSVATIFTQPVEFGMGHRGRYTTGIAELCSRLSALKIETVIRVHPLDNADSWKNLGADVVAADASLEVVLERTKVGVLLDSSVVVDCVAGGIPVVGIGWCPSMYGGLFADWGWMTVAETPEDAGALVRSWFFGAPPSPTDPFATATDEPAFLAFLNSCSLSKPSVQ